MLRLSFLDSKTNRNCFQHFTWLIAWLINMRMIYFSTCFCHFYNNFFWRIRNWLIFENQKYFLVQNYKCILVIFFIQDSPALHTIIKMLEKYYVFITMGTDPKWFIFGFILLFLVQFSVIVIIDGLCKIQERKTMKSYRYVLLKVYVVFFNFSFLGNFCKMGVIF